MKKKVNSFFEWKKSKEKSIEEENCSSNSIISSWEKKDVLYSFIGLYQIGIYVYYPKACKRTNYTIKSSDGKTFMGLQYLTEIIDGKPRFEQFDKLNKVIEKSHLLDVIHSSGNVIPIWPGGNIDKGTRAGCFDLPDIYFGYKYRDWFELLCMKYPLAHLECLNDDYAFDTKEFLDRMNKRTYKEFLDHAVAIINLRKDLLEEKE